MKIILLVGMMASILMSCHGVFKTDVKEFVPGTYTASWATEYSESNDTIGIIRLSSEGSESFMVTRRTHTSYSDSLRKRSPQYRISKWTAVYAEESNTLVISNNGRLLSFDPRAGQMKMGIIIYKKI